jgi:hypothetical protein
MFVRNAVIGMFSAMGAAIDFAIGFDTMANYVAIAMFALGRERMNCTLEAVERVACAAHLHFKRLVIVVTTDFATCHDLILRLRVEETGSLFTCARTVGVKPTARHVGVNSASAMPQGPPALHCHADWAMSMRRNLLQSRPWQVDGKNSGA